MAIFSSPATTTTVTTTPTYDDVVASVKALVDQLDAMSAASGKDIDASNASITSLQAKIVSDTADKTKAEDLSAKLKALLPPEPAPAP